MGTVFEALVFHKTRTSDWHIKTEQLIVARVVGVVPSQEIKEKQFNWRNKVHRDASSAGCVEFLSNLAVALLQNCC